MTAGFKDHFSRHAADYAANRPTYPNALFDWLAEAAPARDLAWDCATGNGQAALSLARSFHQVVATDASQEQIDQAEASPVIEYRVASAEASGLEAGSVDLVTVAQALHWFDIEAFYREVRRVARDGALIAVWTYGLNRVDHGGPIDQVLASFYRGEIDPYWPPERRHIDAAYADLPFPFPLDCEPPPNVSMSCDWTADAMLAYLRTWSSVRRFLADQGGDPVSSIEASLNEAWGEGARMVEWPLTVRSGNVWH